MGNRGVITFKDTTIGVYLHWNGGRDSVEPFLTYAKLKGLPCPRKADPLAGLPGLLAILVNFFGNDGSCVSLENVGDKHEDVDLDVADNGVYEVEDWKIIDRYGMENRSEQNHHDFHEMLDEIDNAQPEAGRLGSDFLYAASALTQYLLIGDEVFLYDQRTKSYKTYPVVGFTSDGIPYVNRWDQEDPAENQNNLLRGPTVPVPQPQAQYADA